MLKLYIKQCFLSYFKKDQLLKYLLVVIITCLLQYPLFTIFSQKNIDSEILINVNLDRDGNYSNVWNYPSYEVTRPIFVFNNDSFNQGKKLVEYIKEKNSNSSDVIILNNTMKKSEVDTFFTENYREKFDSLSYIPNNYNLYYYNWDFSQNQTVEQLLSIYLNEDIGFNMMGLYERDFNKFESKNYLILLKELQRSFPNLLNFLLLTQNDSFIFNKTNNIHIDNYITRANYTNNLIGFRISDFSDYIDFIDSIMKFILNTCLLYLSGICLDVLFKEKDNNTYFVLKSLKFHKFYHMIGNFLPFFLLSITYSLLISSSFSILLYNTNFWFIFYCVIAIHISQFIFYYTISSFLKKEDFFKLKIVTYSLTFINYILNYYSDDLSFIPFIFPPYVTNSIFNYFYFSYKIYYSIEPYFIKEITIFLLFWIFVGITIVLIHDIFNKRKRDSNNYDQLSLNLNDDQNDSELLYKCSDNLEKNNKISIKKNSLNFITGNNRSGKSKTLKKVINSLPHNEINFIFTKKKGILENLSIKENIEFFSYITGYSQDKVNLILKEELPHFFQNFNNENEIEKKPNKANIHLCKLFISLNILASPNKNILIYDQPFNKLKKEETDDLLSYFNFINREKTIIISTNYIPENYHKHSFISKEIVNKANFPESLDKENCNFISKCKIKTLNLFSRYKILEFILLITAVFLLNLLIVLIVKNESGIIKIENKRLQFLDKPPLYLLKEEKSIFEPYITSLNETFKIQFTTSEDPILDTLKENYPFIYKPERIILLSTENGKKKCI
jgi:ABC-type ATPase involved in cell division